MRVLMCGLLGLAVLTGCGGAPAPATGDGGATTDNLRERETVIATCMKQKGFSYNPLGQPPREDRREPGRL